MLLTIVRVILPFGEFITNISAPLTQQELPFAKTYRFVVSFLCSLQHERKAEADRIEKRKTTYNNQGTCHRYFNGRTPGNCNNSTGVGTMNSGPVFAIIFLE